MTSETSSALQGGRLLGEITSRIVAMMREHYGRGPLRAKSYAVGDIVVCVLEDGFTAIEKTMVEGGKQAGVLTARRDFQDVMRERYTEMIERLTGRKVVQFLSQSALGPDRTVEIFFLDGAVPGFIGGVLELVE